MKKYLILLILISIFCFSGQQLTGQDAHEKFTVGVFLTCDGKITKKLIESYIKRDLRSLGDVDILTFLPDNELHIVVLEETTADTGQKTGRIDIATTVTKRVGLDSNNLLGWNNYITTYLLVNQSDIQAACKKIVALFDTDVLEKAREKR